MSEWDYLSETLNRDPYFEDFQRGLKYLKDSGLSFLDTIAKYPSVPGQDQLNQDAKNFASSLMDTKIAKTINKGLDAVMESGADYGIPAGAMGMAPAALWQPTRRFLQKLSPKHFEKLSAKDLQTLEASISSYPSVQNAPIRYALEDSFTAAEGHILLSDYLKGKKPGVITITEPQNYGRLAEQKYSSPALSLLHEGGAGHGITSSPIELASWGKFKEPNFTMYDNPTLLAAEGFAEGGSHTALNKYNKEVFAPYWLEYRNYPSDLKDIYLKSGYLGADFGSDLRKGLVPSQQGAIEEILNILKGAY